MPTRDAAESGTVDMLRESVTFGPVVALLLSDVSGTVTGAVTATTLLTLPVRVVPSDVGVEFMVIDR